MTRLTRALNAARELWHLAALSLGEWWENRLDEGDPDQDATWQRSVIDQGDHYLGRPNP